MHKVLDVAAQDNRPAEAIEILCGHFGFKEPPNQAPWLGSFNKAIRQARTIRGANAWDIASIFLADVALLALDDEQYRHEALHSAPFVAGLSSRLMGDFTGNATRWFNVANVTKTKSHQRAIPEKAPQEAPCPPRNFKQPVSQSTKHQETLSTKRLPPTAPRDHPPITRNDVLVTASDVADRLGCSRRTVQRLLLAGEIRCVPGKPVRVVAADVDRFIERRSKWLEMDRAASETPPTPKRRGRPIRQRPWLS
jgi:excisionase family DNA binding protein